MHGREVVLRYLHERGDQSAEPVSVPGDDTLKRVTHSVRNVAHATQKVKQISLGIQERLTDLIPFEMLGES
jgi:hypothetical protein